MSVTPNDVGAEAVELRTARPNQVNTAQVAVMDVKAPRVKLFVGEPDGTAESRWYTQGDIVVVAGDYWRLESVRAVTAASLHARPDSGLDEVVATLIPLTPA